jgi:hypothetical protein
VRVIAAIAALACGSAAVCAADIELRAVRHGRDVVVTDSWRLAGKLVALVEACSVNSTAQAVSSDTWGQVAASDSFVHVVFAEPRSARVASERGEPRVQRPIREILLPLPEGKWPAHVFVRSGNDVLSFTKYDPIALREVVLEKQLELLTVEPYKFLVDLRKKQ